MASVSPFARAFANQASASVDIPKSQDSAAGSHRAAMLPTPPNSISPTLPPQHKLHSSSLNPKNHKTRNSDSDIDLLDAEPTSAPAPLSTAALSGLEATDTITPSMLAKNHLPDILLHNGPVAIRHVLMNLAQAVPGFSSIPQARARRLVVAALESRSAGSSAQLADGDVAFEKVGWGRWDAYIVGQPRAERAVGNNSTTPGSIPVRGEVARQAAFSPPASIPESYAMSHHGGLQIPRVDAMRFHRDGMYSGSWAASSALSSSHVEHDYDMDMHMAEHEADKMSLDGDNDAGYDSPAPPDAYDDDDDVDLDDEDDATDEEDWAGIGAESLRKGSYGGLGNAGVMRNYNRLSVSSTARMKVGPRSYSHAYAQDRRPSRPGMPMKCATSYHERRISATVGSPLGWDDGTRYGSVGAMGMVQEQDRQEREAVEALLKMGSM